ncbi:hypothetical protein PoB_007487300 [Plakobranchus ocellatus]|uniref:Uncharacterized protein n=1 Tax=Plakobranchus ocellatus TaxID=259542 RepID=A0AAV4DW98_9GAST|nr:hypothetical protein PoB_007487300 [Plakobranchus ocellatus]
MAYSDSSRFVKAALYNSVVSSFLALFGFAAVSRFDPCKRRSWLIAGAYQSFLLKAYVSSCPDTEADMPQRDEGIVSDGLGHWMDGPGWRRHRE